MNVNIKVHLTEEDTFHREQISSETTFAHFLQALFNIAPQEVIPDQQSDTPSRPSLIVEYMDEEDDWIRVNNEEQWSHALQLHTTGLSDQAREVIEDESLKKAQQHHKHRNSRLFRLRIRPNYHKRRKSMVHDEMMDDYFTAIQSSPLLFDKSNNKSTHSPRQQEETIVHCESYPVPPPPPPQPPLMTNTLHRINITTTITSAPIPPPPPAPPAPMMPFQAKKLKGGDYNGGAPSSMGPLSCNSPIVNHMSLQSLQDAITNAKNNLRSLNLGANLVQDYFTPSGVTKTDFLRELSAKIQITQQKKHLSTREEFEMVKDVKQGLHDELLRKCKRQTATAKSNLGTTSPLLEELLRRQKQFSHRQTTKRKDDTIFSDYEVVDHLKVNIIEPEYAAAASSASWITSILSKFTF